MNTSNRASTPHIFPYWAYGDMQPSVTVRFGDLGSQVSIGWASETSRKPCGSFPA
jgi:hypothetical protein